MRRARRVVSVGASVLLVWLAGRTSAGTASKPKAKPASTAPKAVAASWETARPVLPEWAPKDPSLEFLRAARVLRPLPAEADRIMARGLPPEAAKARAAKRMAFVWPAAYEFFGSLSDQQISQFVQVRGIVREDGRPDTPHEHTRGNEVVIPVKQLAAAQRAALDRYFAAHRKAEGFDMLVGIYKVGGARDLSNVRVGFTTAQEGAGHLVGVMFYVTARGATSRLTDDPFAQIPSSL